MASKRLLSSLHHHYVTPSLPLRTTFLLHQPHHQYPHHQIHTLTSSLPKKGSKYGLLVAGLLLFGFNATVAFADQPQKGIFLNFYSLK